VASDQALAQGIARRLAETANRQKVIEEVCIEHNLIWEDARRLVDEALETHYLEITRQQSPVLTLLALISFSSGVALTAWHLLGVLSFFAAVFDPRAPELLSIFRLYSGVFQTLTNLPQAITLFITGLAMITGSTLGMKDVWRGIFDAWDHRHEPIGEDIPLRAPVLQAPVFPAPAQPDSPQRGHTLDGWSTPKSELPEALAMVLENLKSEADAPQIVETLEKKYDLTHQEAYAYIRKALRILQAEKEQPTSPAWMFLALAALVTGGMWIFQFFLTVSAYLSTLPPAIEDVFWGTLQRTAQIGDYIQLFPVPFVFFVLGLALLAGAYYALKTRWLSMFAWYQKQHPN
jgi:hypothetical protein